MSSDVLYGYLNKDGVEVDIVIERWAQALEGVEMKASATLTESDFPLPTYIVWDAAGSRFAGCVVLCGGQAGASNGNELWAVRMRLPSETP